MPSVAARIGSQVPRLQQLPAKAVASAGDDAVEWAQSIGWDEATRRGYYVLDEWQKFCVRGLLSEDPQARLCALVCLIIVARQNGKNVILEVVELYAFYVLELPYILHTAHLQETTADHMDNLWAAIESDPALLSITKRVVANGKERIYRTDKGEDGKRKRCQIRFRTRSKKGGRGGSPQMVVFDEALHLLDKQINALLPSLAAQSMRGDAPILIYTSSAPVEESDVLRRLRSSILAGEIPDAFMAEWSAEFAIRDGETMEQAMLRLADDRDAWFESNPGMNVRISPDWVQANERSTMSVDGFLVERLSVVLDDDNGVSVIPNWATLADPPNPEINYPGSLIAAGRAWALAVSPVELGPQWAAIGVAGRTASGKLHVEWMHHRQGVAWVVPTVVGIQKRTPIPLRVHASGPEGALIPDLVEAGVKLEEVSSADVERATGMLIAAATGDEETAPWLVHLGQASLDKAVAAAVLRTSTNGAAMWSQRRSSVEITPLQAVTVALGGVPAPAAAIAGFHDLDDF